MKAGAVARWAIGIVVIVGLGAVLWFAARPPPITVQGEVSADRVDISPRVGGRIAKLNANVGDTVQSGQVIAVLDNPEAVAALAAAQAALEVAKANLASVGAVRPENVTASRANVAAAQADVTLYQASYDREAQLVRSGNTPQSSVDEATRNLQAAQRKAEAAQADLQLAIAGASAEDRALAAAKVKQAQAAVDQSQVDVDELTIHAPISGEVTTRVAELGENFTAGAPLYSLVDTKNVWFTFNVREDLLDNLKVGDTVDVTVPALASKSIPVRVTVINVEGEYATWRATRATGSFDLRTFEVRGVPTSPIDGLRPGMSAIAGSVQGSQPNAPAR